MSCGQAQSMHGSSWTLPASMIPQTTALMQDQLPVAPTCGVEKISLPAGVSSLEEWSTTLCELPAVAALKKSYAELADDPDQHRYLMWVLQNETKKGPRVEDLAKYLKASKFVEKINDGKSSGATFPGTSIVRKFSLYI